LSDESVAGTRRACAPWARVDLSDPADAL